MNRLDKTLLITVLLLGGILWLQHRWTIRLTEERDRFRMNSTAPVSYTHLDVYKRQAPYITLGKGERYVEMESEGKTYRLCTDARPKN